EREFGLGLDAFGNDGDAQTVAEVDDGPDDRLRIVVGGEPAHERLVDLDLVERKTAQVAKRRIAGAEIVHRDVDAKRAERVQRREHLVAFVHQQRLGDLELEALRGQAGLFQRIHHHDKQIAGAELQWRQVHRNADRIGPARGLRAGTAQYQPANRVDKPSLLG